MATFLSACPGCPGCPPFGCAPVWRRDWGLAQPIRRRGLARIPVVLGQARFEFQNLRFECRHLCRQFAHQQAPINDQCVFLGNAQQGKVGKCFQASNEALGGAMYLSSYIISNKDRRVLLIYLAVFAESVDQPQRPDFMTNLKLMARVGVSYGQCSEENGRRPPSLVGGGFPPSGDDGHGSPQTRRWRTGRPRMRSLSGAVSAWSWPGLGPVGRRSRRVAALPVQPAVSPSTASREPRLPT